VSAGLDALRALLAGWIEREKDWKSVYTDSSKPPEIMSADAWIAATALALSAPLVTNNTRHYRHLDNLQLVSAPVH
jgi:predicted nucleic acid-binding protein